MYSAGDDVAFLHPEFATYFFGVVVRVEANRIGVAYFNKDMPDNPRRSFVWVSHKFVVRVYPDNTNKGQILQWMGKSTTRNECEHYLPLLCPSVYWKQFNTGRAIRCTSTNREVSLMGGSY